MAIIPQKSLFGWEEINDLGDLERFDLIINNLPDEILVQTMEKERNKGRNDYPVRAIWNSILAGCIFQHPTIASLQRELRRNSQLRLVCGFKLGLGSDAVPTSSAYSRFTHKLINKHYNLLEDMFNELVNSMEELLPDFGKRLAVDGKAIQSFANGQNKIDRPDGRRDIDGDWSQKVYKGVRNDGTPWQKVTKWFGYRLHLVVDAKYELPVAFTVTKASNSEIKEAHKIIDTMEKKQSQILNRCEYLMADRGYDDSKFITKLWKDHSIKPIIDIRNMWKDSDKTRLLDSWPNVCYDFKGSIYCYCPVEGTRRTMAYGGFEKNREALKYRCPAQHYGIKCKGQKSCQASKGIRIPLRLNYRTFTPLARSSYKWKREYKKRVSVERVNSRLDMFFNFENHTIRGLKKMKSRCCLSLCVMLAVALGRIQQNNKELMCSLTLSA